MNSKNVLLDKAVNERSELNNKEAFLLRDLLNRHEKYCVSRNNRLLLGVLFLNKASYEKLEIVARVKTCSGQQKYKIVRRNDNA